MIDGFEARPASAISRFWAPGHLLDRQLDAEVAAGDHDPAARRLDDLLRPLGGLRLLDLRDQRDVGAALRTRASTGSRSDGLRTNETASRSMSCSNAKSTQGSSEAPVAGRSVVCARQVHPLVGGDAASGLDLADRPRRRHRDDPQPDSAVREVDRVALVHRLREAVPLHREAARRCPASRWSLREHAPRAGVAGPPRRPRLAEAELRAGQVAEDPDLRPISSLIARIRRTFSACSSGVPWEKLSRKTSTPASISSRSTSGDCGPARWWRRSWCDVPVLPEERRQRPGSEVAGFAGAGVGGTGGAGGSGSVTGPVGASSGSRRALLELLDRRDAPDDAREDQPRRGREQRQEALAAAQRRRGRRSRGPAGPRGSGRRARRARRPGRACSSGSRCARVPARARAAG